jgi:chaperonin GroES
MTLNPSGITPVDMRVLVKPDPVEEKIGSILLTDTAKEKAKYAGTRATLIAVGPNAFKDWGANCGIQVGARVLYAQYSGSEIKGEDGERYCVMNDADLTCTIEGSQ